MVKFNHNELSEKALAFVAGCDQGAIEAYFNECETIEEVIEIAEEQQEEFESEKDLTLYDFDDSVIFNKCSIADIKEYFSITGYYSSIRELNEEIKKLYEGMKSPEVVFY